VVSVGVALASSGTGDYVTGGAVAGDNAAPAINALIHGHLSAVAGVQPFMGLTSILLRSPLAAAATLLGGSDRLIYAAGALICLVPAALLVLWPTSSRRAPRELCFAAAAGALLLFSPAARNAIQAGHPEETLAGALATAAVLAAMRQRRWAAALLLGCAIGTKQWTVIAVLPVLVALRTGRLPALALAGGLAALLNGLLPLLDPGAFRQAAHVVGGTRTANSVSAWWPVSSALSWPAGRLPAPTARALPLGLTRSAALELSLGAALAVVACATLRRRAQKVNPLALLAFLAVVRCALDPGNLHYYYMAVLVPVAVLEVLSLRRAPVLTALTAAILDLSVGAAILLAPAVRDGVVTTCGLVLAAYLWRLSFSLKAAERSSDYLRDDCVRGPARPDRRLLSQRGRLPASAR
jgi:hypothetical protein